MDRSQSLNAPPYFDGSNYAFWNVRMRAFLCLIDESVWDTVDIGWTRPDATKSIWDKAALTAYFMSQNIFCLVPLYKWPCVFKSVACSLSTPYLCGRNLDIYVTVVNRSSNLLWISSQRYCWSWDMHKLVPIYLSTHLFYCFYLKELTKYKYPNGKKYWAAKVCCTY